MCDEIFNGMAKDAAMDIGLTEEEAEDAIDEFNANNCTSYDAFKFCEECGKKLEVGVNCQHEDDDYCNECWGTFEKEYFPNCNK